MKAALLIAAGARRAARAHGAHLWRASQPQVTAAIAASSTALVGHAPFVGAFSASAFSTTTTTPKKPTGGAPKPTADTDDNDSDSDDDEEFDDDSDSDDDEDSDEEEEDEDDEEEPVKAAAAPKRKVHTRRPTARGGARSHGAGDLDEDLEDPTDDMNFWDEERWGKLDSADWQGFEGDLDAVTPEGVPTWLQSVRDLSAIHQENKMRAKLARRAMEEAKKNVVRVRKVDELGRAYGTGRRKTSTARVWVKRSSEPFAGRIRINKQDLTEYFVRDAHREDVLLPFSVVEEIGQFDVFATVKGGGLSGQAGAVRHGISRALQNFDPAYRPLLKKEKLLTRDPRMVERKKAGQKKARKKFQWVKR